MWKWFLELSITYNPFINMVNLYTCISDTVSICTKDRNFSKKLNYLTGATVSTIRRDPYRLINMKFIQRSRIGKHCLQLSFTKNAKNIVTLLLYYNQHPNWKNNKRTNAFEIYKTWVSNFNILSSIRKVCLAQHKMGRRIYYMILTPRQFYLICGIKPKFKSMLHLLPITL